MASNMDVEGDLRKGPPRGTYPPIAPTPTVVVNTKVIPKVSRKAKSLPLKNKRGHAKQDALPNKARRETHNARMNLPSRRFIQHAHLMPQPNPQLVPPFIPTCIYPPHPHAQPLSPYKMPSLPHLPPDPRVVSKGQSHSDFGSRLPTHMNDSTKSPPSRKPVQQNRSEGGTQIHSVAFSGPVPKPRWTECDNGIEGKPEVQHCGHTTCLAMNEQSSLRETCTHPKWLDSDSDDNYGSDIETDAPLTSVFDDTSTGLKSPLELPEMDDKKLFALLCRFTKVFCPIKDMMQRSDSTWNESSSDEDSESEVEASINSGIFCEKEDNYPVEHVQDSGERAVSPQSPQGHVQSIRAVTTFDSSSSTLSPPGHSSTFEASISPGSTTLPGSTSSPGSLSLSDSLF